MEPKMKRITIVPLIVLITVVCFIACKHNSDSGNMVRITGGTFTMAALLMSKVMAVEIFNIKYRLVHFL